MTTPFTWTDVSNGSIADPDIQNELGRAVARHETILGNNFQSLIGCFFSAAGTLCTTPGAGTEVAVTTWAAGSDVSVTVKNGRVYRFEAVYGYFDNTSENYMATIKIRKGLNTIVGQQIGFFRVASPANGAASVNEAWSTCYGKNVSGADITFTPGLTIVRTVGTGTVALFGDSNIECSISVYDVGSTTDPLLAGRAASAVAIT
jgi:hypothetical protein